MKKRVPISGKYRSNMSKSNKMMSKSNRQLSLIIIFITLFISLFISISSPLFSGNENQSGDPLTSDYLYDYLYVKPKSGDGIYSILRRFGIAINTESLQWFRENNADALTRSGGLSMSRQYRLPIILRSYNGKSIRSSIGNNDFDYAKSLESYNLRLWRHGVKSEDFRISRKLWVPLLNFKGIKQDELITKDYPIFGEQYKQVAEQDHLLKGQVYYLVSGHGGPDPGAIGSKAGHKLSEDEYAYDVTLRLARNLIEHGALVYIIVRDPDDGIRDERYLNNNNQEFYLGGDTISHLQRPRLQQRVDIINSLYAKNAKIAASQKAITIHVDSRITNKRIDIFFYHNESSDEGKRTARILLETIETKYKIAQPNRGYEGTISSRELFMLKKTHPVCIYIELGNIQNPRDQLRIVEPDNREAVANWLCDGLIEAAK